MDVSYIKSLLLLKVELQFSHFISIFRYRMACFDIYKCRQNPELLYIYNIEVFALKKGYFM